MAAEELAGEIKVKGKVMTNKTNLKNIVGEGLFNKLFPCEDGLRNVIFHGKVSDHNKFEGLVDDLYRQIVAYLNSEYDIYFETSVVSPQRNQNDNFEAAPSSESFKNEVILDLKTLEDAFSDNIGTGEPQTIFVWNDQPKNY